MLNAWDFDDHNILRNRINFIFVRCRLWRDNHNLLHISSANPKYLRASKLWIAPTYIYSPNTTDIHYFVYFAKQKYFAFKVISWASINWRSGMYITIDWIESEIWALWILNGYCYIFCISKPGRKRVTLHSVGGSVPRARF